MTTVTEIAPDLHRISTYVAEANLQFNQFVLKDTNALLFHSGLRSLFPATVEAIARVIDPSQLRWVAFSHFEADECGALNEWLQIAPSAEPLCSFTAKIVSVDDVSTRPARGAVHGDTIETGKHLVRFLRTPHLPHGWEAGLLFDESTGTLLCSDLFHQSDDVEPVSDQDTVLARTRDVLVRYQSTPLANYWPYTPYTERLMSELAELRPKVLCTMHGSTFAGDGEQALCELAAIVREVYNAPDIQPRHTA